MIVSWNWLQQHVTLDMSVEELEQRLMMAGLNHEGTESVGGDPAIDLEVTSNRPDCLGHIGVAREIAVLYDRDLKLPTAAPTEGATDVTSLISVKIECPELCTRYTARVIQGITIGPSPDWMVRRLATLGVPSINNVVDITNYVLFECGQPLHAFDYNQIGGKQIIVRAALGGERFTAIDHHTYELTTDTCVIADAERAVALGGVMGGAESEVSDSTTDLLIESAAFDQISVRTTARRLNLHSPSSFRPTRDRAAPALSRAWRAARRRRCLARRRGGHGSGTRARSSRALAVCILRRSVRGSLRALQRWAPPAARDSARAAA